MGEEEHALQIGFVQLEIVEEFKYLGSVIRHNRLIQSNIQGCVAMSSCAFGMTKEIHLPEEVTDNPHQACGVQSCGAWNHAMWLRDMDNQTQTNQEIGDLPKSLL